MDNKIGWLIAKVEFASGRCTMDQVRKYNVYIYNTLDKSVIFIPLHFLIQS